jgi:GT2 family glycosyltransferase
MIVLAIPTLNRFDLLDQCIDSALAGTVRPDHILVVDNSAGHCPQRSDVAYIVPGSNVGVAHAWNILVATSAPHQLILSNDDIVFAPDTVAELLRVAEAAPGAGIVSTIEGQRFSLFWLNRLAYESIGPFDEQFWPAYFEDNDYARRLALAGWTLPVAPTGVEHGGSSTIRAFSQQQAQAEHEYFRANEARYVAKWGGGPHRETFLRPYGLV